MDRTAGDASGVAGKISPGPIERFLGLFTDIRPGEAQKALLLALNIFLLLLAYYLIKPVREALLLINAKAPQTKAYLSGAQAILLVFVVKSFSRLASRVPRHILITWTTLFFVSNILIFYVLHLSGTPVKTMGIVFFIWIGIFNIFVVAQFWGFANDLYTDEAGKRIFPLIAVGATLGAVFGSKIAGWIIRPFGSFNLMVLCGAVLLVCIALSRFIHNREFRPSEAEIQGADRASRKDREAQVKPLRPGGGFKLVFQSRYLLFIALLIGIYNFINMTGEYIISDVSTRVALRAVESGTAAGLTMEQLQGKFFADYQFLTNLLALLIQLFLVSRIFKRVGVGGALLFLPLIALGGYGLISFGALLILVKWVKAMENGTDYSLMNTTKAALFLITPREEKYKAKAAIDTFFVRGGDALAALCVFIGTTYFALAIEKFAVINVLMVLVWIALCFLIMKEYKKLKSRGSTP
jgi:AAA family ATP:ADP antiporter